MSEKNPNDTLADEIAKKLISEGLIDKSSEKSFIKSVSQGSFKEADWKTFLEEVINKPKPASDEIKKTEH